jgi:Cu(I)-responsive transcriptional regulator
MKIGELARATGTNAETIRYYERIGLVRRPERTESNYRDYSPKDAERLAFIRHARGLGFELGDVRSLIDLAEQPERDCGEADAIASRHLAAVEEKIARLERLRNELDRMIGDCRGGRVASCRIIEALGDHTHCGPRHGPVDMT